MKRLSFLRNLKIIQEMRAKTTKFISNQWTLCKVNMIWIDFNNHRLISKLIRLKIDFKYNLNEYFRIQNLTIHSHKCNFPILIKVIYNKKMIWATPLSLILKRKFKIALHKIDPNSIYKEKNSNNNLIKFSNKSLHKFIFNKRKI